jgi:hypothetical protein
LKIKLLKSSASCIGALVSDFLLAHERVQNTERSISNVESGCLI